ncbi:MAG: transcriptional repressor [Candidatus Zixiibacteriota bacterium]
MVFERNSRQRDTILAELRKQKTHPTAIGLYEIVRRQLPKISLGTVYRNLDQMAKRGIIQKLEVAGKETRFDGDTSQHFHTICVRCGAIDDVHGLSHLDIGVDISEINGYDITSYHLNFYGICPECKKGSRTN